MKCTKEQAEECRNMGMTYEEIGKKFGISRQRVHQLLNMESKQVYRNGLYYGNGLRAAREAKGIKCIEIAERYGKSKSWVTKLEQGATRIKRSIYEDLCRLYEVDEIEGVIIKNEKEGTKEMLKRLIEENKRLRKRIKTIEQYLEKTKHVLDND